MAAEVELLKEVPSHCGLDLVQLDVFAMDAEECRELHEAITDGNFDLVSRLIENQSTGQYFLHIGGSAVYHAFTEGKYEIAAHLMSKGAKIHESELNIALYLAASKKDKYFDEVIQLFGHYVEKEELKETLQGKNKLDYNVIHELVRYNSPEILIDNLNSVKEIVGDYSFKQLLKGKDIYNRNIIHIYAHKDKTLEGIFQYCNNILGKEETKDLLFSEDNNDCNVIHFLFEYNSSKILIDNLNIVKGVIGDDSFKELLKSKNRLNRSIFHFAACDDKILEFIIQYCDHILGKEETKELLLSKDNKDYNVIHLLVRYNSPEILIDNLNSVRGITGKEVLKKLLKSKCCYNNNIFHFAALGENILEFIIQYCDNILGKEETKELLLSNDYNDFNLIHLLFLEHSTKILIENLDSVKGIVGEEGFKMLLKSKDCNNQNIFHFTASNKDATVLSFLRIYLCEKDLADLLLKRSDYDQTCLHVAAEHNGMKLTALIDYAHKLLRCESRFEKFLLAQDCLGDTFFHIAIKSNHAPEANDVFHIFDFTKHCVSIDVFNKLLRVRNNEGKTFLQLCFKYELYINIMPNKYMEIIIKYFERVLDEDLFEELLKESETEIMQEEPSFCCCS